MRITSITATNYLSFGTGGFSLELTAQNEEGRDGCGHNAGSILQTGNNEDRQGTDSFPLTILVGPNGAGKTNVLRVVRAILNAFDRHDSNVRLSYHRPNGDGQPVKLTMGVQFDQREFEAIGLWWKLALAYGDQLAGLAEIQRSDGEKAHGNQVVPRQREKFALWLLSHLDLAGLTPLAQGELTLEVDDPDQVSSYRRSTRLYWRCSNGLTLDLYDSTLRGESVKPDSGAQTVGRRMAERLPSEDLAELARFLDHETESDLQGITPRPFTEIPADLPMTSLRFTADDVTASAMSEVLGAWVSLRKMFSARNNENYSLGQLVMDLIANAVVDVDSWSAKTVCYLQGFSSSDTVQLREGNLAGYLARLKGGPVADRERYQTIRGQFRCLTGTSVDVRMKPLAVQPSNAYSLQWILRRDPMTPNLVSEVHEATDLQVELVTDDDVPLSNAGAGKAQFLYWVILMNVHGDKVLVLDEPDTHLHPRLTEKLGETLLDSATQSVVISHSPYILPSGRLDLVRRVALHDGASWVTPPMSNETLKELAIRKRGLEADDRSFLFANAVVFVEGRNDAMVLREWFGQWAGENWLRRTGTDIRTCEGKTQVAALMRIADHYGIPCLGVWDVDVLLSKLPGDKKHSAKNNRKVLQQWKDYQLVDPAIIQTLELDCATLFRRFPSGRVFLIGDNERPNMEAVFKKAFGTHWDRKLEAEGYFGPVTYREKARACAPPSWCEAFLTPLFKGICELTGRGEVASPVSAWASDPER